MTQCVKCKEIYLKMALHGKIFLSERHFFFLSGFSFMDTGDSQDSRGRREGTMFCSSKKIFQTFPRYLTLMALKFKKLDQSGRRSMYIYNSKWAFENKNSKSLSHDGKKTWKIYLDKTVASKLLTEKWLEKIFVKLWFREFNEN